MNVTTVPQLRDVLSNYERNYGPDYIVLSTYMVSALSDHILSGETGRGLCRQVLVPEILSESELYAQAKPLPEWQAWAAMSLAYTAYIIRDAEGSPEGREVAINYDQYPDLVMIIRWPETACDAYRCMVNGTSFEGLRPCNAPPSATPTEDTPPPSKS